LGLAALDGDIVEWLKQQHSAFDDTKSAHTKKNSSITVLKFEEVFGGTELL